MKNIIRELVDSLLLREGGSSTMHYSLSARRVSALQNSRTAQFNQGSLCRIRLFILLLFAFSATIGIVWRLYYLQGTQHQRWLVAAARQHKTSLEVRGSRGTIYDRVGRVLAVSVEGTGIALRPKQIADSRRHKQVLPKLLGLSQEEIEGKLGKKSSFVWLSRGAPSLLADALEKENLSGVETVPEFRRYYPQGKTAGVILGAVGRDGRGLAGTELQFNKQLTASARSYRVKRDARGHKVALPAMLSLTSFSNQGGGIGSLGILGGDSQAPLNVSTLADNEFFGRDGSDIALSIDSVLQGILEKEVEIGRKDSKAKQVFAVLMEAESGELLAVAQSNSLDPNNLGGFRSGDLRNVSFQDNFEPGSTLKPLVAAIGIEQGVVRGGEQMNCENGSYRMGRHNIHDVHPIGSVSFSEAVVRSSNICMSKVGERLGRERLHRGLSDFGFGSLSGVEFTGEARGILRPPKSWRRIDMATHSFGQGVAVTALQLTRSYAAIANGGYLVRPTLLRKSAGAEAGRQRIISASTASEVRKMLRGVTEDEGGTGARAKIRGLPVYGKTGTAQKARKDGRGYDPDNVLTSFIGFVDAPIKNQKLSYVLLVVVDEPNVMPRWGGVLAAPIFKRSMEQVLAYVMTQHASEA